MTSFGGNVNRREFVASGVAGAAGAYALANPLSSGAAKVKLPTAGSNRKVLQAVRNMHFPSGVACGEVGQYGITLWTQLPIGIGNTKVTAMVYDRHPNDVGAKRIRSKAFDVSAAGDHGGTVRVRVGNLQAGTQYWYRFKDGAGNSSDVGRFRTAYPADSNTPIKIAYFACQDYGTGFYNAHRDMAAQDVDLVVGLGDYMYENSFFEGGVREVPSTVDGQIRTLDEYRNQYRTYNSDLNLQAVRAMAPMLVIWDDHEVEDNYAGNLQGGYYADPAADGTPARTDQTDGPEFSFAQRRKNGYKAFFETHPIFPKAVEPDRTYSKYRTGMVELFNLDTRQYRTNQPCNPDDAFLGFCGDQKETIDPNASLLGPKQRPWLVNNLKRSTAKWKLISNQVMMMSLDIIFPGFVANTDAWDGYAAERAYICDQIQQNNIKNVSFITGDIHTFFTGTVTRTGRRGDIPYAGLKQGPVVASEFVVGSISSQGISDRVASLYFGSELGQWANQGNPGDHEGFANGVAGLIDPSVTNWNPHMIYANTAYKGYGLMTVTADEMKMDYRATHNPKVDGSSPFTLASFSVQNGNPKVLRQATAASRRKPLPVKKVPNITKNDAANIVTDFIQKH